MRSCVIIRQNEIFTNSTGIWTDIWIKDLLPKFHTCQSSSIEYMEVSVTTEWDLCSNHDATTAIPVRFNSVILMSSGALFPPDQQMSWIALQCESGFVCKESRKRVLFPNINWPFSVVHWGSHTQLVDDRNWLHYWYCRRWRDRNFWSCMWCFSSIIDFFRTADCS